ncbi:MAG: hypothetical protein WCJ31_01550 [Planctomycetia bacterium]
MRSLLFAASVAGVLSAPVPAVKARAEDVAPATDEEKPALTLESRLTTGLKARRPEDVEFVERVAEMVRTGQLPAKVVDSTFLWAIRRGRSYPFPAFQRALRIQADRLGITID